MAHFQSSFEKFLLSRGTNTDGNDVIFRTSSDIIASQHVSNGREEEGMPVLQKIADIFVKGEECHALPPSLHHASGFKEAVCFDDDPPSLDHNFGSLTGCPASIGLVLNNAMLLCSCCRNVINEHDSLLEPQRSSFVPDKLMEPDSTCHDDVKMACTKKEIDAEMVRSLPSESEVYPHCASCPDVQTLDELLVSDRTLPIKRFQEECDSTISVVSPRSNVRANQMDTEECPVEPVAASCDVKLVANTCCCECHCHSLETFFSHPKIQHTVSTHQSQSSGMAKIQSSSTELCSDDLNHVVSPTFCTFESHLPKVGKLAPPLDAETNTGSQLPDVSIPQICIASQREIIGEHIRADPLTKSIFSFNDLGSSLTSHGDINFIESGVMNIKSKSCDQIHCTAPSSLSVKRETCRPANVMNNYFHYEDIDWNCAISETVMTPCPHPDRNNCDKPGIVIKIKMRKSPAKQEMSVVSRSKKHGCIKRNMVAMEAEGLMARLRKRKKTESGMVIALTGSGSHDSGTESHDANVDFCDAVVEASCQHNVVQARMKSKQRHHSVHLDVTSKMTSFVDTSSTDATRMFVNDTVRLSHLQALVYDMLYLVFPSLRIRLRGIFPESPHLLDIIDDVLNVAAFSPSQQYCKDFHDLCSLVQDLSLCRSPCSVSLPQIVLCNKPKHLLTEYQAKVCSLLQTLLPNLPFSFSSIQWIPEELESVLIKILNTNIDKLLRP